MKNIGLMAHVDAGKTTITEQLLFHTGAVRTLGSVDDGTAQTDYMEIEKKRGISVFSAVTQIETEGGKVNLVDTPGHIDFAAEVERALMVLDGVVLVISAVEGLQAHTEIIFRALRRRKIPVILFINKIDRAGADVKEVCTQVRARLDDRICPLYAVTEEGTPQADVVETDFREEAALLDEVLFEQYMEGTLTVETAFARLRELTAEGNVYPVLYGSAINGKGITHLLDVINNFIPDSTGEEQESVAGVVFKISHDAQMGKTAYVRLYSGTLRNRDSVVNATKGVQEKISQIRKFYGEKYVDTGILKAGDIAAVYGMPNASVGDVLGDPALVPEMVHWVDPLLRITMRPALEQERTKLIDALSVLNEEEPTLGFYPPQPGTEIAVNSMGIIQTEVLEQILQERFGVGVVFGGRSVIYKETIAEAGEGFDAYTMPKPCWAVLRFVVEPLARGRGVEYECRVSPKKLPYRYQNHVKTAVSRALAQGIYGWEVTDIKVTLVDGEYHNEHTHPLDFFVATPMALAKALLDAGTILLEPMLTLCISAPEECAGKVIGEIVNAEGEFDSPVIEKGRFTVEAQVPAAKSLDLPAKLAAISGGRGVMTSTLSGYRACPPGFVMTTPRRGVDPLDRSKYILWARNAIGTFGDTL